jgi:flagellar basal-body rod protein FlgG
MLLSERQRDLLLQNIANVNAPAYQRCSLQLTTTLDACTGLVLPIAAAERRNETTGVLEITDRNLDVAIDGLGWFVVRHPHGPQLTRDGSFQIDAQGSLVTAAGGVLEPGITIPRDTLEIAIDPEGRVAVRSASHPDQNQMLGQLVLARPLDASQLRPVADGEFALAADACPLQFGLAGSESFGLLKQGFMERSNVQLLQELLELQQCERTLRAVRRVLAEYGVYTR